jgi:hypothetical protein
MASKRINAVKLKAMGFKRVNTVCLHHAELAVTYKELGDHHKLKLHCNLLDQCADVARQLTKESLVE